MNFIVGGILIVIFVVIMYMIIREVNKTNEKMKTEKRKKDRGPFKIKVLK
jgi:uncharacterized membrane protein